MNSAEQSNSADRGWFTTTHWSVVRRAGREDGTAAAALERLCRTYWKPLFHFARRMGYAEADSEDLTQAFFAHFLEKGTVRAADAERGRFRSFLLSSFRHFADSEWRKAHAVKRGGRQVFIAWEELTVEAAADVEPRDMASADRLFDRKWAQTVFAQALAALRQEYATQRKIAQFDQLKKFIATPAADGAYAEAGQPLGLTANAVTIVVHRMRHRYGELVWAEVANTVSEAQEVEDELRYLMEMLRE